MKYLTYLFAFLVLMMSVSAVCYNQDDSPFCSKDDPTCSVVDEIDTDGDGWSDSCDAFSDNEFLWVDYDGDNIGYGTLVYDCNDLDETILTYCGDTTLLEEDEEEEEVIEEEPLEDESPSRRGKHGHLILVSDPTRSHLQETESLANENDPNEVDDVFVEKEIVPLVQPIPKDDEQRNRITGAVLGTAEAFSIWPLWILILIASVLLLIARAKKDKAYA